LLWKDSATLQIILAIISNWLSHYYRRERTENWGPAKFRQICSDLSGELNHPELRLPEWRLRRSGWKAAEDVWEPEEISLKNP
jgi:hypothetical protein